MHNKAVIYARVSSVGDRQDTKRQVEDLMRYAVAADLDVVAVYEEKASGAKEDRAVLSDCITALKGGVAGTLLLSEISRLGRNVKLILEVMDSLAKSETISIFSILTLILCFLMEVRTLLRRCFLQFSVSVLSWSERTSSAVLTADVS